MNKTYLIIGGASVASLAAGAAGGYLIAKKKFNAQIDGLIDVEVEKTKKYFSVLMMEHKENAASPSEIADQSAVYSDGMDLNEVEDDEEDEEDEELGEADQEIVDNAKTALVNYQGFAAKPELSALVQNNIFNAAVNAKKKRPPRDKSTGQFTVKPADREKTPYLITAEEFLLNDPEHEQVNYKYFIKDATLIDYDNDEVEIGLVGEVNLTLFPDVPEGEPSIICVRNEGLERDYEIQRTYESLTEYMGLGEDDEEEYDADEIINQL